MAGPLVCCTEMIPEVEKLVRDSEAIVRQGLVESIPSLSLWLRDNITLDMYTVNVLHILLPLVAELTTDDNPQTRASAVAALVDMAKVWWSLRCCWY